MKINSIKYYFLLALLIVFFFIMNHNCNKIVNDIESISLEYASFLNKKVVIDKDTLTIVSYNLFNETFSLSNGIDIKYSKIEEFLLKE